MVIPFPALFNMDVVLFHCLLQGEKYLILKKKYRNLVQEREAKHLRPDGDRQRHLSPARMTASVQWEVTEAPTSTHHEKEEQDVPMSCGEADATAEVNLKSAHYSLLIVKARKTVGQTGRG